ncbi:hypothetical protein XELAEV_18015240mg [Xenopus laevis]|uniref:Uncharacterized protein n=1 Tax=Xenopus laevis TaxID=8355 RepID=A0A974DIS0_XENLA|nr:hypothetical protein XELAEV_18015240mg [Xenopus laevis]
MVVWGAQFQAIQFAMSVQLQSREKAVWNKASSVLFLSCKINNKMWVGGLYTFMKKQSKNYNCLYLLYD